MIVSHTAPRFFPTRHGENSGMTTSVIITIERARLGWFYYLESSTQLAHGDLTATDLSRLSMNGRLMGRQSEFVATSETSVLGQPISPTSEFVDSGTCNGAGEGDSGQVRQSSQCAMPTNQFVPPQFPMGFQPNAGFPLSRKLPRYRLLARDAFRYIPP